MNTQTLVYHGDIQRWAAARRGQPAIHREPDRTGNVRARLAISFPRHERITETPTQDDGLSPCSWTAWLAELDRQQLALKVSDRQPGYELVPRAELN